jgi:hypothetical protein
LLGSVSCWPRRRKRRPKRQHKRRRNRSCRQPLFSAPTVRGREAPASARPTCSREQQIAQQRGRLGTLLDAERLQPRSQQRHPGVARQAAAASSGSLAHRFTINRFPTYLASLWRPKRALQSNARSRGLSEQLGQPTHP